MENTRVIEEFLGPLPRKRLDTAASDRIMRVASAIAEAVEIFGDKDKAIGWFKTPSIVLGGQQPIDLMTTDPGAKVVRDELSRIRCGLGVIQTFRLVQAKFRGALWTGEGGLYVDGRWHTRRVVRAARRAPS